MKWVKPVAVAAAAAGITTATAVYTGRGGDDTILLPVEKVKAGAHGLVRSTRALYTYSLRGFDRRSDDYRRVLSEVHLRSARRILQLCESNKGFYSKAGQFIASMRQVPKEYSLILSSLLDQAAPCDLEAIKKVLLHNFGKDISEIFMSFDERPIAAASIAQVHHAVLKNGLHVAVKVQYPGLEDKMKIDIATMAALSKIVSWVFPDYRFEWAITEFRKTISLELDFLQEAKNCERTSKNFRMNGVVRVPRIFWDLTRERVLTMQFFTGNKVDDVEYMRSNGINPAKVAKALVDVFSEMIFVHGFLHGDPHPGNILVSPEGSEGFSLVILDHGLYKELDDGFRLDYCRLWKALIFLDQQQIQLFGEKHGVGKYAKFFSVIFTGRSISSKSALGKGMSDEDKKVLKQELGSLAVEDVSLFLESLPSELLVILRTDGLLRSIITKLGASQRIRLLSYFKYAAYGLYTKSNSEPNLGSRCTGSSFLAVVEYIELRVYLEIIELISWAKAAGNSLLEKVYTFYSKLLFFFS